MCGDNLLRAFKCVVELAINEVSAPGVRLANKEDLYVNVCLLGQQRRTRLVPAVFPLKFYDNLVFEKTFRFCTSPCDVMDFLADLHVLIELIQLGQSAKNEVIACYEMNARDFLYPSSCCCPTYHSAQRDLFMHKAVGFPGQISPQLVFCTFTSVCETQTPSLDILREHEGRIVPDPLIELKREDALRRKLAKDQLRFGAASQSRADNYYSTATSGGGGEFANHTISSAIKADYTQPQVKSKIGELKPSVQRIKIVRDSRGARVNKPKNVTVSSQHEERRTPFVVRHVDQNLIARKTELHDMLHDGLVLTNKNPKKIYGYAKRRRGQGRRATSASWRTFDDVEPYGTRYGESSLDRRPPRVSRSLSPGSPRQLLLERPYSLNESLNEVNYRPVYRSRSRTHSPAASNCDVCYDSELRKALPLSRSNSNSSVLFGRSRSPYRDHLNETQILQSQVLSNNKVKKCKKGPRKGGLRKKSPSKFPTSHHPSAGSPCDNINWRYTRYYPWLYNYSSYLRDLDDELYWLRVRSRYMSSC